MVERNNSLVLEPVVGRSELSLDQKKDLSKVVARLLGNAVQHPDQPDRLQTTYRKGDRIIDLSFAPGEKPAGPIDLKQQMEKALSEPGNAYFAVNIRRAVGVTEEGKPVINEREAIVTPEMDDIKPGEPGYNYKDNTAVFEATGKFQHNLFRVETGPVRFAQSMSEALGKQLVTNYNNTRLERRYIETMAILDTLKPGDEVKKGEGIPVFPTPSEHRVIREGNSEI